MILSLDPGKKNFAYSFVAGTPATKQDDPQAQPLVGVLATGADTIRAVPNLMVSADDLAAAVEVFGTVLCG